MEQPLVVADQHLDQEEAEGEQAVGVQAVEVQAVGVQAEEDQVEEVDQPGEVPPEGKGALPLAGVSVDRLAEHPAERLAEEEELLEVAVQHEVAVGRLEEVPTSETASKM